MFLPTLIAQQFGDGLTPITRGGAFDPGANGGNAAVSLENSISLIIGLLTILAGLAFVLYFSFAGLQWVLAGGDQGKVDKAKQQMTNGAIGLIVIVVSYGVIAVIGTVLGLDILNPGTAIIQLYKGTSIP